MRLYVAFALECGFPVFPATEISLQAFAEFFLQSVEAPKSVLNALASLKHFQRDLRMDVQAFDSWPLQLWKRALLLNCRHVPRPAPPFPFSLVEQVCMLCDKLGAEGVVFAALCAILYASMARLSSLLADNGGLYDRTRLPTLADIKHWEGVWQLRIKWAKAHQEAPNGFWVPLLARGSSPACPVRCWLRLQARAGRGRGATPLFSTPDLGGSGRSTDRPLTMSVARKWLSVVLKRLGRANEGFSFHSFRRGACSSAFEQGALEADIKQLGGWRSEAVRDYLPVRIAQRRAASALLFLTSRSTFGRGTCLPDR